MPIWPRSPAWTLSCGNALLLIELVKLNELN